MSLWGLSDTWPLPPQVTTRTRRRRPGILTHEASNLRGKDFRTRTAIRVTSPARTILDCARDLDRWNRLGRTLADARRAHTVSEGALLDVCDFHRDHPTITGDHDTDRLVADIETVRMTWDRLTLTPDHEAARLHKLFRKRAPSTASESAARLSRRRVLRLGPDAAAPW